MAVQQNKKSRSRRDMRRSHDALTLSLIHILSNLQAKLQNKLVQTKQKQNAPAYCQNVT